MFPHRVFPLVIFSVLMASTVGNHVTLECFFQDPSCIFSDVSLVSPLSDVNITVLHADIHRDVYIMDVKFESSYVFYIPHQIFEKFPRLTQLDIGGVHLKEINQEDFKNAKYLTLFRASYNRIRSLDANIFDGALSLQEIYLNHNQIEEINKYAFTGIPQLKILNLNHNEIAHLHKNTFIYLVNLEEIHFEANKIDFVPEEIFERNLKLNRINLANNKIVKMSNRMFNNLKNLNHLDIRDNICVNEYFLYANQNFDLIESNLQPCVNNNDAIAIGLLEQKNKAENGEKMLEEKFLNFTEDIVKSIEVLRFGFQYFTDHVKTLENSIEMMEKKIQNLTEELKSTNQYVDYLGVFLRSNNNHSP